MQLTALPPIVAASLLWLALPAVPLTLTASVPAQRGYHVDSQVGFKFRLPQKWRRWPAEKDRRFLTGHYVSTKEWHIKGSATAHRPTLHVLVLPKRPEPNAAQAAAKKTGPVSVVEFYSGYKDYLARNLSGFLMYTDSDKGESDGVPYTEYQIRRRENDRVYRLTTRVYDFEKHSVAVEFMVLDDHATVLKQRLQMCLRSFRRTPVESGTTDGDPWAPPLWIRDAERWGQLSQKDRLARRAKYEEKFIARVRENLAPTFKIKASKHFLIVSNADSRFTTQITKAADSIMEWCHEHLSGVSDETVIKSVIRVFGKKTDYWMYRTRSRRFSHYVPGIREIIVAPDRRPPKEITGLEDLTEGILHYYLHDKDKDLHRNLPEWIRVGLGNYLRLSKLERGKFVLEVSDREKRVVRDGRRSKRIESVKRIITQTQAQKDESDRTLRYERGRVVRFVFDSLKKPAKSTIPQNFISEYFVAVCAAQQQFGVGAWSPGCGRVPGLTDDIAKSNAEADDKTRLKLLETVNMAVCKWSEGQWAVVHKAYDKFNKKP
jgi:hypothetical protein